MKRHPQIYIDHQVWTIQLDSHSQVGMKNATSTLSRTMIEVFRAYLDRFLKVFVDDLNVHSLSSEKHLEHLHYVLLKLREVNFKLNLRKCEFEKANLAFLGHVSCDDT